MSVFACKTKHPDCKTAYCTACVPITGALLQIPEAVRTVEAGVVREMTDAEKIAAGLVTTPPTKEEIAAQETAQRVEKYRELAILELSKNMALSADDFAADAMIDKAITEIKT